MTGGGGIAGMWLQRGAALTGSSAHLQQEFPHLRARSTCEPATARYPCTCLCGNASHHPRCFLLGRQPPVWRELIDQVWQMLTQASEQIIHAQAGLLAQCVERIAPERIRQILGRDVLIRAGADPGLRDAAMSAVL